jgi:hypothetical protein
MRNLITFQPIVFAAHMPGMLAGLVECHDCGTCVSMHFALSHSWRTVEREITADVTTTDYICADCCEARVLEYNQMVADAADDL